jgi:hypothetical protein
MTSAIAYVSALYKFQDKLSKTFRLEGLNGLVQMVGNVIVPQNPNKMEVRSYTIPYGENNIVVVFYQCEHCGKDIALIYVVPTAECKLVISKNDVEWKYLHNISKCDCCYGSE